MHGWPHTHDLWNLVLPQLARTRRVIAPDLRGLGGSRRETDGYDLHTLADDMAGLVDALAVDQADVVAIDAGTPPAFMLAMRAPQRVRRLVLMESLLGTLPGAESFLRGRAAMVVRLPSGPRPGRDRAGRPRSRVPRLVPPRRHPRRNRGAGPRPRRVRRRLRRCRGVALRLRVLPRDAGQRASDRRRGGGGAPGCPHDGDRGPSGRGRVVPPAGAGGRPAHRPADRPLRPPHPAGRAGGVPPPRPTVPRVIVRT
ncbi:alpha/beta fold hydrolase [Candidatus Frankia alpina]|uniref:alpha/beta fold hydrolase n=1 Tax=Candidatus Frankia alpina TaxID=2699483 RepID=UPI00399FA064